MAKRNLPLLQQKRWKYGFGELYEKKAEQELKKLGLKVKKAYANSDTVKEGYVIKQSPKGGSIVNTGFAVTITISKGVSKTTVQILNWSFSECCRKRAKQSGINFGSVSYDYSGEVGEGDVISREWDQRTSVDKGTKVPIVLVFVRRSPLLRRQRDN